MRRILLKKPLVIAASALACYTLAGFFLTPWLVKRYVPQVLERQFKTRAAIGGVRMNPFLLTAEITDFSLSEETGSPLAGFGRLFVDLQASSILHWAWIFRDIQLESPMAGVVIEKDGGINLLKHLAPPPLREDRNEKVPPDAQKSALPRVLFRAVTIHGGRIDAADMRQSRAARLAVHPIDITLTDISTLPGREGAYSGEAKTGDGASIQWTGHISLAPFRSRGTLAIKNLRAASLWTFAGDALNLAEPGGDADAKLQYDVAAEGDGLKAAVRELEVRLSGLSLKLDKEAAPFLSASEITLQKGRLDLSRREAAAGALSVRGGRFDTGVDADGGLRLQRILRPGATKPAAGSKTQPAPWNLTVDQITVDNFGLAFADMSRKPEARVQASTIRLSSKAMVATGPGEPRVRLENIELKIQDAGLGLVQEAGRIVSIPAVKVSSGVFDLADRSVTVAGIEMTGGTVALIRDKAGEMNLLNLLAPQKMGEVKEQRIEDGKAGKPWQFMARKVQIQEFRSSLTDAAISQEKPVIELAGISALLLNVDGKSPTDFSLAMTMVQGGRMSLKGTADPAGPQVDAAIDAADLNLTPFQPYIEPFVDLEIASGRVSTQGTLRYGEGGASARAVYAGKVQSDDLRLVEIRSRETVAGWKSLQTSAVRMELEPNQLLIDEIILLQPEGKLFISRDGSVNIVKLIKVRGNGKASAGASGEAPTPAKEAFPIRISKIRISKGLLDFTDLSLIPPFASKIRELDGVIIGMASAKNARAQVKLEGRVDDYGQARIEGEINVFDPKGFTDIGMVFRNVEMTRLSPYSGKFAGRRIASGKISLDLKYKITDSQLMGDNKIIVDRLVLGEKVDSPDASNLPLDLAVALMQDSNGVIDIGLPVRGNLDDPKFSIGHLIGKAIANLITKIATAPFRALGALLGMKDDTLNTVAFEAGSTALPPPEREKLVKLTEALRQRPQLKVIVTGRYHPDEDGRALKDLQVRRTLAEKRGVPLSPGEDPGPVDFSNPRVQQTLKTWYVERFGAEALENMPARNAATGADDAPDPGSLSKEMFARLVEKEPLETTTLAAVGAGRAGAVVKALTGSEGLPADRVATASPEAKTGKRDAMSAGLILAVGATEKLPAR
ncbi:DUF748 domain-containing protein [Desulfococcus sp.]|uniref:DUF748 domain-containing protein n=1 Tax=Desulfococcus sp. TaxID=2025834 RepID=UPI003593D130